MQAILGGRRVATLWSSMLLALGLAACGGGGNDADRVAVLEVHSVDSQQALLLDAAQEHGAPGESEPVLYRIRSGEPGAAQAAAATLRAHGFVDVEVE